MRTRISREDLLQSRAVLNPDARLEELDSGAMVISYRPQTSFWDRLLRFLMPSPELKQIVLDKQGGVVVRAVKSNLTISEITALLSSEFQINPREAETALLRFLAMLGQRGLVFFQLPSKTQEAS